MRIVYATQFDLPENAFKSVVFQLRDWVADFYGADPEEHTPEDGSLWSPVEGDVVIAQHQVVEEDRLFELQWTLPDRRENPTFDRRFETTVVRCEAEVQFDLVVSMAYRQFRVAQIDTEEIVRPGIVDQIVRRFDCRVGGSLIQWYAKRVTEVSLESFLRRTLEHQRRALPAVLVSRKEDTGEPLCDSEAMQKRLLGVANVFELTEEASAALSERVGEVRSCYNGAVRVYWPGFTRRSIPKDHPYYLASTIQRHAKQGRALKEHLFRQMARLAAERYSPSPLVRRVQARLDEIKRARLREQAKDVPGEWLEDHEQVLAEQERLRRENEQLAAENDRLKKALEHNQATFSELARYYDGAEDAIAPDRQTVRVDELESVEDALRAAEERYGEWIYVWDSASKAARKGHYDRPEEVFKALEAVAELAERYNAEDGAVGPWKEHFSQRGLKYAEHEGKATMNQYGDQRRFHDSGRAEVMVKHITIGQNREHCWQIFFDRSDEDRRFQIGYCGEHLDIDSYNT